jgi:hypothetical protein
MSPESIGQQVYSKKSDVWMFGIVVYEIVARREPHDDKDPLNASTQIRDEGLTPEIPSNCPQKLVELMQMCWKKQPQQRPVSSLFSLLFVSLFCFLFFVFFISHNTHQHNNLICFFLDLKC